MRTLERSRARSPGKMVRIFFRRGTCGRTVMAAALARRSHDLQHSKIQAIRTRTGVYALCIFGMSHANATV